jgi:hypothetical protein
MERATESFMVATGCRVVDRDWRERVMVADWEMNDVQVGSFILGGMDFLSHVIPEIWTARYRCSTGSGERAQSARDKSR